jgi:hypothetical protein
VLNRNALASLIAPTLQDQLAAFRFHARSKAMRLGATPVVGLVCSLWHSVVLLKTFDCSIAPRRPSIPAFAIKKKPCGECNPDTAQPLSQDPFLVVEMKKRKC